MVQIYVPLEATLYNPCLQPKDLVRFYNWTRTQTRTLGGTHTTSPELWNLKLNLQVKWHVESRCDNDCGLIDGLIYDTDWCSDPHSCAPLHQGLMPSCLDVFQWLIASSTASLSVYLRRPDFAFVEASWVSCANPYCASCDSSPLLCDLSLFKGWAALIRSRAPYSKGLLSCLSET